MAREKISLPSQDKAVTAPALTSSRVMTSRDVQAIMPHYRVTIQQEPIIEENRPLVEVVAHLPEEFAIDTQSEYDTPFADGLVQDRRVQTLMQLAGWSPTVQAMTAHFWRGSSPIELNIPLTFFARDGNSNISGELLKLKSMQLPRVDPATKFLRPPGPRMNLNPEAAKRMFNATADAGVAVAGAMTNNKIGDETAQAPGTTIDANESALDKSMRIGKTFGTQFANSAQELITVTGKISIRLGKFLYFKDVVIRGVSDAYNIVLGPDQRPQQLTVTVSAVTRLTPTYEDLIGADGIYQLDDPLVASFDLPGLNTSRDLIATAGATDWTTKAKNLATGAVDSARNVADQALDQASSAFDQAKDKVTDLFT